MDGDREKEEPEVLNWSVRLWEQAPERRWIVLAAALLAAGLGYALFQTLLLALVGFGAVMGSTAEYWSPLRYKLDSRGAAVRCGISTTMIEWSAVKRVVQTEIGVKLSPLEKETRTAVFRGVFLRYAGNRDAVLEYVDNLRGESARILGERTDG
jgi:hypothetical protein